MDTHGRVKAVVTAAGPSKNDPAGTYTGKPVDPNDKPTQDSDDL